MSTSLSEILLPLLITYGPPMLGLFLLLGAAGLPLPGSLLVIATGAFVRQGFLDWPFSAAIALAGAVLGDSIGFGLGYHARSWAENRFGGSPTWQTATQAFEKGGSQAVFLTRFLITAAAVPVNLIAGSSDYSYRRFLVFALLGETVWVFGYGGLGYLFGSEWELVSTFLSDFGGLVLGLALLVGALMYWRRQQTRE